jgi:hypothetical protein
MANYEGPKWGSATPGAGATVTWSFAELNFTSSLAPVYNGYLTFDSAIAASYRGVVESAMSAWEAVSGVDLVEVSDSTTSNIRVGNLYIDGAAAPGQSSTLGATKYWFSASGKLMSTAEVYFDTDAYTSGNFYAVAVHEIGHALGLDHSGLSSAVMYYMLNSQNNSGKLTADDIGGIQYLYGPHPATSSSLATLQTAFTNVLRIAPSDALNATAPLSNGDTTPSSAAPQAQSLVSLANSVDTGATTLAKAITTIGHYADDTTSVATLTYQFFTGKIPTSAGLDYLVHSSSNANDLNDPYYAQFNIENRYINFSVNLGKLGEAANTFQSKYGAASLAATLSAAYTQVFGTAPSDAKVQDILNAQVSVGGATMSRAAYFAIYGGDGASGLGTKAAAVGFLLAEAVKSDTGTYALANDKFIADLAGGGAHYNVDLTSAYAAMATDGASGFDTYETHTDSFVAIVGMAAGYGDALA